jgi:hypothetical protein
MGHYALIQFRDDARLEVANVGMVVISEELSLVEVRLGRSAVAEAMVARFGSAFELMLEGFAHRLTETLKRDLRADALRIFMASGANPLQISAVRECYMTYGEDELSALFRDLVL